MSTLRSCSCQERSAFSTGVLQFQMGLQRLKTDGASVTFNRVKQPELHGRCLPIGWETWSGGWAAFGWYDGTNSGCRCVIERASDHVSQPQQGVHLPFRWQVSLSQMNLLSSFPQSDRPEEENNDCFAVKWRRRCSGESHSAVTSVWHELPADRLMSSNQASPLWQVHAGAVIGELQLRCCQPAVQVNRQTFKFVYQLWKKPLVS